jgi:hypothetical protein
VPRPTPADFYVHRWPMEAWLWMVPFATATAAYLVGSAVALATDHPWRWYAGFVLCWALLAMAGLREELAPLVVGRYGWGVMVTAGEWQQATLRTPAGATVFAGRFVPDPARWSAAIALWMAFGAGALAFAARRHQERCGGFERLRTLPGPVAARYSPASKVHERKGAAPVSRAAPFRSRQVFA